MHACMPLPSLLRLWSTTCRLFHTRVENLLRIWCTVCTSHPIYQLSHRLRTGIEQLQREVQDLGKAAALVRAAESHGEHLAAPTYAPFMRAGG